MLTLMFINRMTYCLGIKVKDGLVGISDTRISAGTNITVKKKAFVVQNAENSFFIMTSELRSVRDKAVHYWTVQEAKKENVDLLCDGLLEGETLRERIVEAPRQEQQVPISANTVLWNASPSLRSRRPCADWRMRAHSNAREVQRTTAVLCSEP